MTLDRVIVKLPEGRFAQDDEDDANITLIAAAPDLLAALKDCVAELRAIHHYFYRRDARSFSFTNRGDIPPCRSGCPAETYCAAADAAIKKAEGGGSHV